MSKIHPTAVIHDGAKLGADIEIGPYCIVGADATLGDGSRLMSHVVIDGVTEIGQQCVIHPFAYLGGSPQRIRRRKCRWHCTPILFALTLGVAVAPVLLAGRWRHLTINEFCFLPK